MTGELFPNADFYNSRKKSAEEQDPSLEFFLKEAREFVKRGYSVKMAAIKAIRQDRRINRDSAASKEYIRKIIKILTPKKSIQPEQLDLL